MILGTLELSPVFLSREEQRHGSTIEWTAFDGSTSAGLGGMLIGFDRVREDIQAELLSLSTFAPSGFSLTEARTRSSFESAQRELERYGRYPSSWDGYGAAPFDRGLLQEFAELLCVSEKYFLRGSQAPSLVTTGPASDGSIDLEIETLDHRLLLTKYPGESQAKVSVTSTSDSNEHTVAFRTVDLARWLAGVDNTELLQELLVLDQEDPQP